jgi:tetratricopeptide (TPR) repeat protein
MTAYLQMGRFEEALPLQREALERAFAQWAGDDPSAELLNEFAWVLLIAEFEGLQDPERALALARRACERAEAEAGAELWQYLDTLALALHGTGDTAAAVATQRRALELTPEDADSGVRARLAEYEAALGDR